MECLAPLGPTGHHESDPSGEKRKEFHEVTDTRLSERQLPAGGSHNLKSYHAFADSGPPVGAFGQSRVQPRTDTQHQDESDTCDVTAGDGAKAILATDQERDPAHDNGDENSSQGLHNDIDRCRPDTKPEARVLGRARHSHSLGAGRPGKTNIGWVILRRVDQEISTKKAELAIG